MPGNSNSLPQSTPLDPNVINLAKAIRDVESGGNFQARGKSGEYGAYQFMPTTWQKVAPQFGVNKALDMASPEEQNKVAYHYIESLRKQGYNPGQIASIWNSGRSNPSGNVGVNSSGASYNTPQYVENVYNKYAYYKGQGVTPDVDGRPGTPVNELPQYHATFPNQKDDSALVSGAKAIGNVPGSAIGLVKDFASLFFHPIQTAQNISGIAIGGLESLDDELETENTEKFDMFVQAMKDRYGSLDALENTAVNDPFGFGADVLGLLYGGAGLAQKAGIVQKGAATGALNSAVDVVGGAAMSPVRAVTGRIPNPVRPFQKSVDAATAEAAARLGMEATELPASARSTSRIVPLAEALAGKSYGGDLIPERAAAAAQKLTSLADDLVRAADGADDLVVAGERIAKGISEYATQFKKTMDELYTSFENKRGDTLAQTSNSVRLIEDILTRKEAIGDVEGARFFKQKYDVLTGTKKRGKKRVAPTYTTLKDMRTDLGQRVKGFGDMFVTANKAQLKQLYGALSTDMRSTIKTTRNSKALLAEMDAANAAYRAGRSQLDTAFINSILRFAKNKQFDKILPALLRPSTSINDIKTIMAITGEAGTTQIRTSLLKQVFDKATGAGDEFTPAGISKQLAKEGEKWKQILLPEQYQALEDLSRVTQALGRSKKISEGSQTAYTMAQLGQLGIMGWSVIDLFTGNLVGFAQKWAGLGMAYGAAKFVASPMGQRILTTGLFKRAEIQAAIAQQGLTPPAEGGMLAGYDITDSTSDLRGGVRRGDQARRPGEPGAGAMGGGRSGAGGAEGADEALRGALTPIIERAKARSGLDFNVEDVQMTGSRSAGKGTKKSDMDVIVQISGTADEAAVLAALRRGRTKVDGAKVDYTVTKEPIADFRARTEDPEKYAAPLTSEFVPDTRVGRLKESLRRYIDNMGVGLSTRDVSRGGQEFEVGLTSVKGRFETGADDLVREGDELYAAGDFPAAQKKYNEALSAGIETLTRAYEGTGIKVKPKGVGFGVYGGLEPNYDAIAVVPKGKEDLFHYILADVADRDFKQYSMLTTRQTALDTPYGVIDEARGISVEPSLHFVLEKPLSGADVTKVQELVAKNSLAGFSLREGGKSIDITNLSAYNKDYEKFKQDIANFSEDLGREGFSGVPEYRTAETRFVGSDPAEGHGLASYQSVRSQFRQENPDFFNSDEGFTSRVIDRIKNRQTVSPMEIEQLTKMQDITPLERSVVLSALEDLKDVKKIPTKDLVARIEGKSLPVSMYETDSYASYGIDNVNIRENRTFPKTLVFETPVEHGSSGHFNNPRHFGHTRVAIVEEGGKKIGYITEMQSDVAQKASLDPAKLSEASRAKKIDDLLEPARKKAADARDELRARFSKDGVAQVNAEYRSLDQKITEEYGKEVDRVIAEVNESMGGVLPDTQQLAALLKDRNKYQDVMLRGTLQYFEKEGVQEVRVATPSSAAKIEGFVSDDGAIPYTRWNGDRYGQDEYVSAGDELDYAGNKYIALNDGGGDSFDAAPADSVREFSWKDFVDEETQYRWDEEGTSDFKDLATKGGDITPEGAKKALESKEFDSFISKQVLDEIVESDRRWSMSDVEERFKEIYMDETDFEESLRDAYGSDKVFIETRRIMSKVYRNETVRVVEEGGSTEMFEQPSSYSAFDQENVKDIDADPKLIADQFSDTQRTVLENYVDLRGGALKRLEKTEGVKVKYLDDDDHSWYSFPMTKVKRYLFGA